MTVTAKALVQGSVLTGAAVSYYATPASARAVIKSATVCNTTAGAISVTVHIVPSAGAPAAANTLISARSVAAGASDNCPELVNKVLEPSSTLQALGSGLTLVVGGVEIT